MGFIKIHRNIREWGWYDDANTFAVWVHLLIDANYEDKTWHGEAVEVGSMITSTAKLADEIGLSVKQIRTCLDRLVKDGKITVKGASRWTKITVCDYESYMLNGEDGWQAKDKQTASKGQTDGKQKATPKEDKEMKEKKSSNEDKEKDAELLEAAKRIYNAYPASTVRDGKVRYTRNRKDEGRIVSLLKSKAYTEERLLSIIKRYVEEKQGQYLRNLEHFLNNIPDYPDESLFRQGSPEKEYDPASPENQVDPELRRMFAGRYKRP